MYSAPQQRRPDPDAPQTQNLPPIRESDYEPPPPPRRRRSSNGGYIGQDDDASKRINALLGGSADALEPRVPADDLDRPRSEPVADTPSRRHAAPPVGDRPHVAGSDRAHGARHDKAQAGGTAAEAAPAVGDRAKPGRRRATPGVGDRAKAAGIAAKAGVAGAAAAAAGFLGSKFGRKDASDQAQGASDQAQGAAGTGTRQARFDPSTVDDEPLVFGQAADDGHDRPHDEPTAAPAAEEQHVVRKRRRPRRTKRGGWKHKLTVLVIVFLVFPALAFGLMYLLASPPSPQEAAAELPQTVTYKYSDGSVMGKDASGGNRVSLKPSQIPNRVKHAVYAAEDATFETNKGFDLSGIMRGLTGRGGGSTITQQYIKQATGQNQRSGIGAYVRKATEIVKAYKLTNQMPKSQIITAYLNTIYFGRGAYGIEAAAQAYFNEHTNQLTSSQAAFLAGVIQAPGRGDDESYTKGRWSYVLDQMVQHHWLSKGDRQKAQYPQRIKPGTLKIKGFNGPETYIKDRVSDELQQLGYSPDDVRAGGYTITTTIDPTAQQAAEDAANETMDGQPKNLHDALVAVDPNTGGIRAYYGGKYDKSNGIDWANTPRPPGSSIKPFDFVGLLKLGMGPYEVFDGSSPRTFGNMKKPVHNSDGEQCPQCTVMEAMKKSVNTVFFDMVFNRVHPKGVVDAAREAGVSSKSPLNAHQAGIAIGGGDGTAVRPRDMAAGYASFASQGMRHTSHFVDKIVAPNGKVVYANKNNGVPAFDKDPDKSKQIAGNVTMTLKDVISYSRLSCPPGIDCYGKTGTHQYTPKPGEPDTGDNSHAWMAGYTRQMAAAVWVGGKKDNDKLLDKFGGKVWGRTLPGQMWQNFMTKLALQEGWPNTPFDQVQVIGKQGPPPGLSTSLEPGETADPNAQGQTGGVGGEQGQLGGQTNGGQQQQVPTQQQPTGGNTTGGTTGGNGGTGGNTSGTGSTSGNGNGRGGGHGGGHGGG